MEKKPLQRWADFERELTALRSNSLGAHVLFRGHSDATWGLETTLERAGLPNCSLASYFRILMRVRPAIEAHTGQRWILPKLQTYLRWASNYDRVSGFSAWKAYEFMAYLRHHGFPSPLLDWSKSPYVAAFFAFQPRTSHSDQVAIFAYREPATTIMVGNPDMPQIRQLPEYVRTHARHFRQQCEYTVCTEYRSESLETALIGRPGGVHYAPHDAVLGPPELFDPGERNPGQLWKFTLPRTERAHVMGLLNDFNLNAYSLFGTEDALMSTLAEKEIRPR